MIKAITFLAGVASASISSCAIGAFQINSMSLLPDPPVIGQNTTMTITFTNPSDAVTAGVAKYSFNYNGIPYSETDDLCTQTECPITTGEHTVTSSALWDGSLSGKLSTTIQWTDPSNTLLLCVQTLIRS
jgi:hypothetical protein